MRTWVRIADRLVPVRPSLWVALVALPGVLAAQVRQDPISGDYFVTVLNDAHQPVEMRVEPPNKVQVTVSFAIVPGTDSPRRFVYTVAVAAASPQALGFFEVDCPNAQGVSSLSAVPVIAGRPGRWYADHVSWDRGPSCVFERGADGLPAGGVLTASLETVLLPAPGQFR